MRWVEWLRGAPPSRTQFIELFNHALKQRGCNEAVSRLPNVYGLQIGLHARVFLDGIYTQYCNTSRQRRRDVLDRFIGAMLATTSVKIPHYEEARPHILPLLRSPLALALAKQVSESQSFQPLPAARELADFLVLQLGFDQERSISRLTEQELKRWGVSFDQALQDSIANLRARTSDKWQMLAPGLYMGDWRDDYESSRILLTDLICRLKVRGEPVAMIPTRNTLLVTGSQDMAGLKNLARVAEEILHREANWVIAQPLVLTQAGWQLFNVPAQLRLAFRRLSLIDAAGAYHHQTQQLKERFADMTVADYHLLSQGHELLSVAVWQQSEKAQLLPYTDLVNFSRFNSQGVAENIHVPFTAVKQMLADSIVMTDHIPPRYQVGDFPDDALWQRLLISRVSLFQKKAGAPLQRGS